VRILNVTQGYAPAIGGTESVMQRLSEELVRQFGDEVTVFTTDCLSGEAFANPASPALTAGWDDLNGVRVRRFPVRRRVSRLATSPQRFAWRHRLPLNQYLRALASGPVIPGLTREIRRYPADVVVASSFPLLHMFSALRAASASRRPCVYFGGLHPDDDWGFDRPMIYRAIRAATCYVAYTGFEAEHVVARGAEPERVFALGAGVDAERFTAIPSSDAKERLGLGRHPVVGYIGQLGGHKGVDTLLRAMPIVWRVVPDARLLIAGARAMFADEIERIIGSWPAHDRQKVVLRYNFPEAEKPALFSAIDAFAYPSGYESFGIAFLEAWSCGKPVIGCRRGAIPWVVEGGRDGLLVDYLSDEMLAEAILVLLQNPGYARALGEAGRKKTLERYTWPRIAQRCREVYVEALRRATPGVVGARGEA
jgi:glycosyltransferase involved in cell wall biosynthesis